MKERSFKSLKTKKRLTYLLFIFFIFSLFSTKALSAPITFQTKNDMDFGEIVAGSTTSAFKLSTTGTLTQVSGDGVIMGGEQEGKVTIKGDKNKFVDFTINSVSNLTGPGGAIPITLYTTNSPVKTKKNALIGATITLGTNQTSGNYTGSYTITAEYQASPGTTYISSTQSVSLKVVAQPTVTETTQMSFGRFLPDTNGGTVALSQNGNISNTSGTATFLGGHQLGIFGLTGEPSTSVNITFSSGDVLSGAGTDISLDDLSTQSSTVNLGGSGSKNIDVKGSITYSAGQTPDIYQGNYIIFVNY